MQSSEAASAALPWARSTEDTPARAGGVEYPAFLHQKDPVMSKMPFAAMGVPRELFARILERIQQLGVPPLPMQHG